MPRLRTIGGPADVRSLSPEQLTELAAEIRAFLVEHVARGGGHLGPNLGVVELTLALHRVFDSPADPIIFDVGHQAYVHKIVTGRGDAFDTLRTRKGLSGYPSREESPHDWMENSHASTSLSYADGLAKAFAVRGERGRTVVAVIGDGSMTGGMAWEALNNIAANRRNPLVIVLNDNGRSYAPTAGGMAERLAALRLRPGYERMLHRVKHTLPRTPVVGRPLYSALHAAKTAIRDWFLPQMLFQDLGLKYVGPIDGHDIAAVETALRRAKGFRGPVLVHVLTQKGRGYPPAEADDVEQMHSPPAFDPRTGRPVAVGTGETFGEAFGREIERHGRQRPDLVAITAAMCGPTGLTPFATAFPDRIYDVGIAEQHAMGSAAGLALGGMHPVVALYSTFLNRALDQLLMDCALHKLGVTVVLDRAGVTGPDGPSHHGMWDLTLGAMIPGLRVAAPRDVPSLVEQFAEALQVDDGPTLLRYPKGEAPEPLSARRRVGVVDVLAEPAGTESDVLLIGVGPFAAIGVEVAARLADQGIRVTVVDPRWVLPVPPELIEMATGHRLVVTVEDGGRSGGVGAAVADMLRPTGVPVRIFALPQEFLPAGSRTELLTEVGLTTQAIARGITEDIAGLEQTSSTGEVHPWTPGLER